MRKYRLNIIQLIETAAKLDPVSGALMAMSLREELVKSPYCISIERQCDSDGEYISYELEFRFASTVQALEVMEMSPLFLEAPSAWRILD